MGCEVIRVLEPQHLNQGLIDAQARAKAQRVPVVVECICERVTNIAMGQSIAAINEFEPIDCRDGDLTAETFWVPKMEKIDA
jgi:tartronate-semialdehyde synthase